MKNRVVKSSYIFYLDSGHPDRIYQIAEEYFRRAEDCQAACYYAKARAYYQKAEEWFYRARDGYLMKRQAEEARKQAIEARSLAGEGYIPLKQPRNVYRFQQMPEPQEFPPSARLAVRRQPPKPNRAPAWVPKQAEKAPKPVTHDAPGEDISALLPAVPDGSAKNVQHPISWRGKRHG
ncbi:MAG: hypothetical protein LBR76_00805 [Oscillospiraceae bacterium]|jgi:hypothetical protein|nr:hypothetical protein [Oscillospiraceae bacterium]